MQTTKQKVTVTFLGDKPINGHIKRQTTIGYIVVWNAKDNTGQHANEEVGEWFPFKSNKVECFV